MIVPCPTPEGTRRSVWGKTNAKSKKGKSTKRKAIQMKKRKKKMGRTSCVEVEADR